MSTALLQVEGLKTYFHTEEGVVRAVDDISFSLIPGETLGIVGESGSGKSVTSLTLMRLLPEKGPEVSANKVAFLGKDLQTLSSREMVAIRGREMAMIFQEPMTSLNPVHRVGAQVEETILCHQDVSQKEARRQTIDLFREVGIPDPEERVDSYPHQMSGGQKQRVMIAMALACNPKLLIADEPSTALDVTIQAQILELLRKLRDDRGMAMMFITHDLGVIAEIADRVAVMYRGRLVEYGDVLSVFERPRHPYTQGLLACRPRLDTPYRILPTVQDYMESWVEDGHVRVRRRTMTEERHQELIGGGQEKKASPEGDPLLEVDGLKVWFAKSSTIFARKDAYIKAVDGVDFKIWRGQTLGLVGESGCGKTTTGRALLRLIEPTAGRVRFKGVDVASLPNRQLRKLRRQMQIIFQDPYASLNPRITIEQTLTEPMMVHGIGNSYQDRRDRAAQLLEEVGLPAIYLRRYPHEFSGGQRQRICIARALSVEPEFVICDESVSALDVSVQAQVLNLLKELQERRGLTYIFISHDLAVVKFMSDVMAVMREGRFVEHGPSEAIYADPKEAYTRQLIAAIPKDDLDHIRGLQARRRQAQNLQAPETTTHWAAPTDDPEPDEGEDEGVVVDDDSAGASEADRRLVSFFALPAEDASIAPSTPRHVAELPAWVLDRLLPEVDPNYPGVPVDDVEQRLAELQAEPELGGGVAEALRGLHAWIHRSDHPILAWNVEERSPEASEVG